MNVHKTIIKILLFTVVLICFTFPVQTQINVELRKVDVYFYFLGTEGLESEILPLKRSVSSKAPLFPAIQELLKDATAEEQTLGYASAGYGDLRLESVKIKRGTARIDFKRTISEDFNPGDLQTLAFESAVKKTAKQFPAVKKVIVCVNGMNEFGIGMVMDAPVRCPALR